MEECFICYNKTVDCDLKVLSCQHKLCYSCYLRLSNNFCPYCRQLFNYTKDEITKRQELNISYINNNNTSPQLFNENLSSINSFNRFNNNSNNNVNSNDYIPFSRLNRNKHRKRRRELTFIEIQQRRTNIRKKCNKKWSMKDGRLDKLKWYEIDN